MFRKVKQWCYGALTTVAVLGAFHVSAADAQPDGEALFKTNCATCHQPHKDGTGPKLYQVRQKWASESGDDQLIYTWVANWKAAAAANPYAQKISGVKPTAMNLFPNLAGKKAEIDAILDYVDAQPDPATAVTVTPGDNTGGAGTEMEEEAEFPLVWVLLAVIFAVIILAVGGVRRQLNNATKEVAGISVDNEKTFADEFRSWAWKYKRWVGFGGLIIVISLIVGLFLNLYSIGVVEAYQPSQPIEFPHTIHAGINGIDCKYCHNSVTKSKSAGLPTVNVCMNCHKQIAGAGEQVAKIKKIYEAAGWDGAQYTGKTKEIIWNKVHVLPDHVYFNHSQHVVVGGLDCKQCHGDMTKQQETAKVMPVEELNKIEGNVVLTKPTLTMGWCIECHAEKEIMAGSLGDKTKAGSTEKDGYYTEIHKRLLNNDKSLYGKYLEDGKVTVKELGGWECAKCHY